MAKIRLRIRVNEGRIGVPIRKFAAVSQNTFQFLLLAAKDLGLETSESDWIATDFASGSAAFTLESEQVFSVQQVAKYDTEIRNVIESAKKLEQPKTKFKTKTLFQYTKIAEPIDAEEYVSLGFFLIDNNFDDDNPSEWHRVTRYDSAELAARLALKREYYGAVLGKIHALYKEASPPYFNIRLFETNELVKCQFQPKDYDKVIELLKNRDAFVHVGGNISANLLEQEIAFIDADRFKIATSFDKDSYLRLLGSQPGFTGDLSTGDFLSWLRDKE